MQEISRIIKPSRAILPFFQLIIAAFTVAIVFVSYTYIPIKIIMLTACGVFTATGAFTVLIYFPLWFKHLQYSIDNETITKKSGAIFRFERTVKFSSIQFCDIISTPFSSHTSLNFLVLNVYGGKMLLLFLKKSEMDFILHRTGKDYC